MEAEERVLCSQPCLYPTLEFGKWSMRVLVEKGPYLEGKPTLQSTWPDAAQQLGTGTMGGKGDMSKPHSYCSEDWS